MTVNDFGKFNWSGIIISVLLVIVTAAVTYGITVNGNLADTNQKIADANVSVAVLGTQQINTQRDVDRICGLLEQLIDKLPETKETR